MALRKFTRNVLKLFSAGGIELKSARNLANIKALDPLKPFYKTIDETIMNQDYPVPVRIYLPEKEAKVFMDGTRPVMIFIHGGGWVTESVANYDRICAKMASSTGQIVVSVEYRLAPEHRFPMGLSDCYAVVKAIFKKHFVINVHPEHITLIGDSAGGNLTAALCQMARDKGEFQIRRQILIYPALNNDYTESSPYPSVKENGTQFLLTAQKMCDYLEFYQSSKEDLENPYFAPLMAKQYENLPQTLILTAEFDPLRDEGEEYAKRLKAAGVSVDVHRLKDALHGYFALGLKHFHVEESFQLINYFLSGEFA